MFRITKILLFPFTISLIVACASAPAVSPVEAAANAGDPGALNYLCYGYIYGKNGYPKDYKHALYWCRKGAEAGDSNSQTLYAEMYYFGEGVTKNYAIARNWYLRAAKQGHVHAEYMMAVLEFQSGSPNMNVLCYWLMKSMAQYYPKAELLYDDLEKRWAASNPGKPALCKKPV